VVVHNRLNRVVAWIYRLPASWRPTLLSRLFGSQVKLVGTAGIRVQAISRSSATLSIANRAKVQNHIQGVHAAAMALLAESATGFLVGMNLPDSKLLLLKSLQVDYRKRVVGGLTAVASLTPEQIAAIAQQDKGELWVAVAVTDETGTAPIECAMCWAWLSKKPPSPSNGG
jgi:acyl-coenzyme A thioesterase PaaI-like protein